MSVLNAFAEAFDRADLVAMRTLLAPDATAEVLGSGFPVERGRDAIARTSLPHLLEPDAALGASVVDTGEEAWILLRLRGGDGPLDTAVRLEVEGEEIQRLEYVVAPHRSAELRRIGAACGVPTVADAENGPVEGLRSGD